MLTLELQLKRLKERKRQNFNFYPSEYYVLCVPRILHFPSSSRTYLILSHPLFAYANLAGKEFLSKTRVILSFSSVLLPILSIYLSSQPAS